jgi:hypothetical protein
MLDDFEPVPSGPPFEDIKQVLDIARDWQGTLGESKLRLVVRMTASEGDGWTAMLYSVVT